MHHCIFLPQRMSNPTQVPTISKPQATLLTM
jgi:hypothetical protein